MRLDEIKTKEELEQVKNLIDCESSLRRYTDSLREVLKSILKRAEEDLKENGTSDITQFYDITGDYFAFSSSTDIFDYLKESGKTSFKDFIDMGFTSAEEFATLLLEGEVRIVLNVVDEKTKNKRGDK